MSEPANNDRLSAWQWLRVSMPAVVAVAIFVSVLKMDFKEAR